MKRLLFIAAGLFFTTAYGQITEGENTLKTESKDTTDGWKIGGSASLTGAQTSLTNWNAGGQNSLTVNSLFNLNANWKKGSSSWDNSLILGYGLLKQGNRLFENTGQKWIKTDDRIDLTSKYGRRANKDWYYAGLMNFRTQSTAGYAYPNDSIEISGFMAPGYWLTAVGMDYKPNDKFSLFVAPFTSKMTFVNDQSFADAGLFGVTEAEKDANGLAIAGTGKRIRNEFGGYLRMQYKTGFGPNNEEGKKHMFFTTRFDAFTNYIKNPSRIDVSWETLIEVKLFSVLSLTLSTHLIYDDDVNITVLDNDGKQTGFGPRVQFKEVFGVGLAYNFGDQPK